MSEKETLSGKGIFCFGEFLEPQPNPIPKNKIVAHSDVCRSSILNLRQDSRTNTMLFLNNSKLFLRKKIATYNENQYQYQFEYQF